MHIIYCKILLTTLFIRYFDQNSKDSCNYASKQSLIFIFNISSIFNFLHLGFRFRLIRIFIQFQ